MILSNKIIVSWNPTTRKHYENLGYTYTKHKDKFEIPIEHLHPGSNQYIDIICDICGQQDSKRYNRLLPIKNKHGLDICNNCIYHFNTQDRNNKNPELIKYNTYEKRKEQLKIYIENNKTIGNVTRNRELNKLYSMFSKNNEDIYGVALELGYNIDDIINKQMPNNFYDKYPEILISKIQTFIDENNRFPLISEMQTILKINGAYICKKGGIQYFKNLLNYNDEKDLIDLRGDYNRSVGELIVANYFCSQGLKDYYDREVHPFTDEYSNYRSDFTFEINNSEKLHIEVWGVKKNETNIRSERYNKARELKESLYKKYNIKYIGIEYDIFDMNYNDIQKCLYETFSQYLQLKFKKISYKKLFSPSMMTDDEIFNEIISLSNDKFTFPTTEELSDYSVNLYREILKRGYTYLQFANKYNCTLKARNYEWDVNLVYAFFDKMVNKNIFISKKNVKKFNSALADALDSCGYITKLKIKYFTKRDIVPEQELEWLINLANNRPKTTTYYTENDVKFAKKLLDKHYSEFYKESYCRMCKCTINMFHIYDIYCEYCKEDIINGTINYKKIYTPYTEKEYDDNFIKYVNLPNTLTTVGFNEVSEIKVQAYRNYFGLVWIDILKKYNKYNDFLNYIVDEYIKYYGNLYSKNFLVFGTKHKYLSRGIIEQVNQQELIDLLNNKLKQSA